MKRFLLAVLSVAAIGVISMSSVSSAQADVVCRDTTDGKTTVCTCDSSSSCDDLAATCRSHGTSLSCQPGSSICGCAWNN